MNARHSFRALLATTTGVLALVVGVAYGFGGTADAAVPPGYVLTWCGRLLGSLYGLGGTVGGVALGLTLLALAMLLAGGLAWLRTVCTTRAVVRKLTAQTAPFPASVASLADELGIADRLVLSTSPGVFSFCFGTWRPRICASRGLVEALTPDELRAVLAHERHHLVERDPFKTACAGVLAAIAFPLPLAWALRRAYLTARELDADRAAMAVAGRLALAGAIHKVVTHPQAVVLHSAAAVGSFSGSGARIDQVIRPEVPCYPRIGSGVLLASLGTVALFALGVLGPLGHSSANRSVAPGAPAFTPSPMAPMVCQTLWGRCSGDMDSAACCISPVFSPPWSDRLIDVTEP